MKEINLLAILFIMILSSCGQKSQFEEVVEVVKKQENQITEKYLNIFDEGTPSLESVNFSEITSPTSTSSIRFYVRNKSSSPVQIRTQAFEDLFSVANGTSRFQITNISSLCRVKDGNGMTTLGVNKSCYFDLKARYVLGEDHASAVEFNFIQGTDPEYTKVLFIAPTKLDFSQQISNQLEPSSLNYDFGNVPDAANPSNKRIYLINRSSFARDFSPITSVQFPSSSFSIVGETCLSKPIKHKEFCYIDVKYSFSSGETIQDQNMIITPNASDNITVEPIRLTASSASTPPDSLVANSGILVTNNLAIGVETINRYYITNRYDNFYDFNSNPIDLSSVVSESNGLITSPQTNCTGLLAPFKSCFIDFKYLNSVAGPEISVIASFQLQGKPKYVVAG
ncbi:MAG: hypothetical protein OHK0036_18140 [Bacteroidia bacterium]